MSKDKGAVNGENKVEPKAEPKLLHNGADKGGNYVWELYDIVPSQELVNKRKAEKGFSFCIAGEVTAYGEAGADGKKPELAKGIIIVLSNMKKDTPGAKTYRIAAQAAARAKLAGKVEGKSTSKLESLE